MDLRSDQVFSSLLGRAVSRCWGELPQEIQQKIYEAAAAAGCADDNNLFRERLAVYLHNRHPRTGQQTASPRELSTGGPPPTGDRARQAAFDLEQT